MRLEKLYYFYLLDQGLGQPKPLNAGDYVIAFQKPEP
jgi:hypothetical protein